LQCGRLQRRNSYIPEFARQADMPWTTLPAAYALSSHQYDLSGQQARAGHVRSGCCRKHDKSREMTRHASLYKRTE
jgi:hypothetical protein